MNIKDIINWLKENYQTVDLPHSIYKIEGDYSDVLDNCICIIRKSVNIDEEYHKRHSVSLEKLCYELEKEFEDKN